MGKRTDKPKKPKKEPRLILVLVEGASEVNALSGVLEDLYKQIDPQYKVELITLADPDQECGDITSKYGVHPGNIEKMIWKLFLQPYQIRKQGIMLKKDVKEIVQLVDLDGAFVPEETILYREHEGQVGKDKVVYTEEAIYTSHVDEIRERNERKRANLQHLIGQDTIKVDSRTVPYHIYYFASNLDTFLHCESNLTSQEKYDRARDYNLRYLEDLDGFKSSILNDPDVAQGRTYEESWQDVMEGTASLHRHTNLNLLIERVQNQGDEN